MIYWLLIAIVGLIFSFFGAKTIYGKYRRHEVSKKYFLAIIVGFLSFVAYAVLSSIWSETSGIITIAILLPAFISILIVISEHQKKRLT